MRVLWYKRLREAGFSDKEAKRLVTRNAECKDCKGS